ncbi:STAS/SEC14 domain-containing protein [candidate division WOR-3 bacterium]|nr:STAS/SEC14 domain-containing protein [candidate division WOR-3 bacterium]
MNYEMWYNEEHEVLYVKTLAMLKEEDVNEIMPKVGQILEDKTRRLIIGDLSDNPTGLLSKGAREAFRKNADKIKVDKIAVIGANPSIRMIAKIALVVMGKSQIAKFFSEEDDALRWLKGDAKRET